MGCEGHVLTPLFWVVAFPATGPDALQHRHAIGLWWPCRTGWAGFMRNSVLAATRDMVIASTVKVGSFGLISKLGGYQCRSERTGDDARQDGSLLPVAQGI